MKIVPQSAKFLYCTPSAMSFIELCGRTAYQSKPKNAVAFVQKLISLGHLSVLEHAVASFRLVTDRGISHELVRHRIASYTQESTRYCDYTGEITVIAPSDLSSTAYKCWAISVRESERCYLELRERGVHPQFARSILPICLKTEIVITANFREWLHIFELRLSAAAHPQMRELMGMCKEKLHILYPDIF